MALKKIKISLFFIIAIFLVLGLSISFQSLLAAWTAPAANPPTCATGDPGCDAPLNVGPLIQPKSGALWLNTNGLSPYGLIVENGYVGIGTTGPNEKLEVNTGNIAQTVSNYNNGWGQWQRIGTPPGSAFGFGHVDGRYGYLTQWDSDYAFFGLNNVGADRKDVVIDWEQLGDNLQFRVAGSPLVTIKGAGNVGIGTTGPGAKLEVAGQVKITGGTPGVNKVLTSDASGMATWQTPASFSEADTLQTVTTRGNTTNLGLIVNGQTINHQANNFLYVNSYDGLQLRINADGAGTSNFRINNSANNTVFTVKNSGNVGIGTVSPRAKLDVYGDIMSDGSNMWMFHTPDDGRKSLYFGRGSNGNVAEWPIEFKAGGGASFAGNLDVVGTVRMPGFLLTGNSATMNLSAGATYTVLCWGTYFTCGDYGTWLRLDGSIIKYYAGAGGDSDGCDQNTIMVRRTGVTGGTHTWSFNRGSQWDFMWMAFRE